MANYVEARIKLANTQLSKLKSTAKNKTGAIFILNKKRWKISTRITSNKKTSN